MMLRAFAMALVCAIAAACGHDAPPERENAVRHPTGEVAPSAPGSTPGQRPGVSEGDDLSKELADDVWRIAGPDITLRYDRGGVLFNKKPDGTIEVHDLDGAACVRVTPGVEGADSVMTGACLIADDREVAIGQLKMLRHGDGRTWYRLTDASESRWILVLP